MTQKVDGNRWRLVVEFTFDIEPNDIKEKFTGDTLVDFQRRALNRVKPSLDNLIESGEFAHYCIQEMPQGCHESD